MKKLLITFFTVLFCLTSSVGWSKTLIECNILLPKLKTDLINPTTDNPNGTVVKFHKILYEIDDKNQKLTEDGNDDFFILKWNHDEIYASNNKPKKFNFQPWKNSWFLENPDINTVVHLNRINGKLTFNFTKRIKTETEEQLCIEDGHQECNIMDLWTVADYSTFDDKWSRCSKIKRKF